MRVRASRQSGNDADIGLAVSCSRSPRTARRGPLEQLRARPATHRPFHHWGAAAGTDQVDHASGPGAAEHLWPLIYSLRIAAGHGGEYGAGSGADQCVEHLPRGSAQWRRRNASLHAADRLYSASPRLDSQLQHGSEPGDTAVLRRRGRHGILSRPAGFDKRTLRPDCLLWQCSLCRQPGGVQRQRHDLHSHHRRRQTATSTLVST